jgi:hypothetical protein|tara:strand:- start:156 stop:311 length:156 start_codon:yes stop_codon:yes gene_type:complete
MTADKIETTNIFSIKIIKEIIKSGSTINNNLLTISMKKRLILLIKCTSNKR